MTKLYASGETPAVGDVVRFDGGQRHSGARPGDVFTTIPVRGHINRDAIWINYGPGQGELWCAAERFTLIARAGDPVTFQPGDVVECVEEKHAGGGKRSPRVGDRITIRLTSPAIEGGEWLAPQGYFRSLDPTCRGYRSHCFRLVHRPDAPAAVEPAPAPTFGVGDRVKSKRTGREYQVLRVDGERIEVPGFPGTWEFDRFTLVEPVPTTAEIVATLRHGDRVRYVIESTVDLSERTDNALDYWLFDDADVMGGTIEILSRAAPQPSVGKLSSTDDLLPGDVLVCTTPGLGLHGEQVTVKGLESSSLIRTSAGLYHSSHFAFVRRPV